jgi:hypothetical protein
MNMLLTLLTLIAIILIDRTLGKAFDSQCNNKDIFRKELRGMQRAKEILSSDRAKFYTNPRKSETNNSSAFKRLSVPILNDVPASTMSRILSQLTVVSTSSFSHFHVPTLTVVPTSSFSHFHIPTNATSTATGLTSLNDVTIAHVSATTATTETATKTQVPATQTATTNVPKYQLDKCKATRTQHKTRSPSILHPAKKAANYATQKNLLLFFVRNDAAITISSLLLPRYFERPAITTAMNASFSLQLIVELLSTGTKQVAPATILDDSFKLIDVLALEGATFAPYIFEDAFNRANNIPSLLFQRLSETIQAAASNPKS